MILKERALPITTYTTVHKYSITFIVIDRILMNGTVLGTIDQDTSSSVLDHEISDNSIDQNTISHFQHHDSSPSGETLSHKSSTTMQPSIKHKNTIAPLSSAAVTHHSSNTHPTAAHNESTLLYGTSNNPNRTTINGDNAVLDLLTTFQSSITASITDPSKIETTSTMTTTKQQFLFTKSPATTTEENTKFQTFQSVQETVTTTTSAPTPTKRRNPSRRPPNISTKPTKRHRPTLSVVTSAKPENENSSTTKKVIKVTTTATSKPVMTTRRPSTTKPSIHAVSSERPTTAPILTKPTRRVTQSSVRPLININITSSTPPTVTNLIKVPLKDDTIATHNPVHKTTTSQPFITISYVETTKVPRPKPTKQIIKISPTSLDHLVELEIPLTTTQSVVSSVTTTTPSTVEHLSLSVSTTTLTVETKTEATANVHKPMTSYNASSAENEIKPIVNETTQMPVLVTWSNIHTENNSTNGESYTETPATPTDWILIPSVLPAETSTVESLEQNTHENVSFTQQREPTTTSSSTTAVKPENVTETPAITSSISTNAKPGNEPTSSKPSKPSTTKPTKLSTTKIPTTTTTKTTSTTTATFLSTQMLIKNNVTETTSKSPMLSTQVTITSGSPIVFPNDGVTESSLVNDTVVKGNDTNETTTVPSTTTMLSLEGIDYRQVCGKRMYPEPRIVGGSKASFGRWPWQISLRQWRTSTYLHKCGAALLNENWAITAAHCVDNVPPSDLLLRLGEYDLAEEEEPYGYQERRVQIVASHPQFDPRTFEYDLALLRFYEPVEFQPNIIPVCVPETDENFIGRTAFVTGWGRLYEDGPLPSVLQEVSVPVINNTICESMYRNAGYIEHIPHIFICAGWRKGGYDSCEGDSGGPMVIQRDDKRFLLAGVISWGIGCAEPNQPGVYTRISEFRDWINQILQF
ncbi:Serine proteinase stubble [Pseudolycoriella hygida]|uniref:Serine proteinase stubble n=1 Tax=Pseudolycoriella hygida TaxID=35572 RepID=A0A9Q0N3R9_9DIPT|nr:Serine proteinase stubble [Pseudolycoriella hygida]